MPSSCSQQRVTYVLGGQLNNHDEAGGHTSSVLFMSTAGCESRRLTTATWPSWAAIYRAVAPPCSGKTDLLSITDSSTSWAARLPYLVDSLRKCTRSKYGLCSINVPTAACNYETRVASLQKK